MEIEYLNDKEELRQFYGTSRYYQHCYGMVYTDGVLCLCKTFNCFWLLDLIVSYQKDERIKDLSIQFWECILDDKGGCNVFVIKDTNMPKRINQKIEYTDIPGNVKIWVQNKVVFLPSEY